MSEQRINAVVTIRLPLDVPVEASDEDKAEACVSAVARAEDMQHHWAMLGWELVDDGEPMFEKAVRAGILAQRTDAACGFEVVDTASESAWVGAPRGRSKEEPIRRWQLSARSTGRYTLTRGEQFALDVKGPEILPHDGIIEVVEVRG
jgi:hypothetical protein